MSDPESIIVLYTFFKTFSNLVLKNFQGPYNHFSSSSSSNLLDWTSHNNYPLTINWSWTKQKKLELKENWFSANYHTVWTKKACRLLWSWLMLSFSECYHSSMFKVCLAFLHLPVQRVFLDNVINQLMLSFS